MKSQTLSLNYAIECNATLQWSVFLPKAASCVYFSISMVFCLVWHTFTILGSFKEKHVIHTLFNVIWTLNKAFLDCRYILYTNKRVGELFYTCSIRVLIYLQLFSQNYWGFLVFSNIRPRVSSGNMDKQLPKHCYEPEKLRTLSLNYIIEFYDTFQCSVIKSYWICLFLSFKLFVTYIWDSMFL